MMLHIHRVSARLDGIFDVLEFGAGRLKVRKEWLMNGLLENLPPEEVKAIFRQASKEGAKEAMAEFLQDYFAMVGKWTLQGVFGMVVAGVIYLFIYFHGFGTVGKSG